MILGKFWDTKKYRDFDMINANIEIGNEYGGVERGGLNGQYYFEGDSFIAILSWQKKNFIFLKSKLIELTSGMRVDYYCGEQNEKSWIKIYNNDSLLYEIEYLNPNEPYIDFASGFEDRDTINFGYHLAGYIDKARNNPDAVLFP